MPCAWAASRIVSLFAMAQPRQPMPNRKSTCADSGFSRRSSAIVLFAVNAMQLMLSLPPYLYVQVSGSVSCDLPTGADNPPTAPANPPVFPNGKGGKDGIRIRGGVLL